MKRRQGAVDFCTRTDSWYRVVVVNGATNDTRPEIEAILLQGYRRMSPSQKLARVRALTLAVQELALLDVRRRHPDAKERELALRVASRWIGSELMSRAFGWNPRTAGGLMAGGPILVLATLAGILDALNIPYLVGGSFASSMYGIPRATPRVHVQGGCLPAAGRRLVAGRNGPGTRGNARGASGRNTHACLLGLDVCNAAQ